LAVSCQYLVELPEFRSDEEIKSEVLRRLHDDARFVGIERYTLRVDVDAGVVRLQGRVRTTDLKRAAEELARGVRGVLSVTNDVLADDEIARQVEDAMAELRVADVEVRVLLGQVTLRGWVESPEQRRAAAHLARSVPGVRSVVNELSVEGVTASV
jgi:osmotically-inducible protein OsmY